MNEITKKVLAGAVSGAVGAFLADLHAWSKSTGAYDWGLAAKRWIGGAIGGAMGALGMSDM